MKRDDIIKLSNGQEATIIRGDESELKNSYIVKLEDGELRVIAVSYTHLTLPTILRV